VIPPLFPRLLRAGIARTLAPALALALFSGCLSYERSETRVTFDRKTGMAKVQVTYWNLASTETSRDGQRKDFEQLDSLRRSNAYFLSSFLRTPGAGTVSKRRVWIEGGRINASYTIQTRDLNQIAEGWSAGTAGYRYVSMIRVAKTNGRRTTDEKPAVVWPRKSPLLLVVESDPHFGEAVPFLPEFRESLAVRLRRSAPKPTPVKAATTRPTKKRSTRR
jgi:hypothetical protein